MSLPRFLKREGQDFLLSIKVQPRSKANQIGKLLGNELQIKLRAPPVDNAANAALLAWLAEILHARKNQVEFVRGHTTCHKIVRVRGVSLGTIIEALRPVA